MTRVEKILVWGSSILVGATGIAYGWMKYLMTSNDPFAVVHHPLQPLLLKLHLLAAPPFVFAIGVVWVRHVWRHFRSGTRRKRRSGITAALTVGPMIATGYLIQVLTPLSLLLAVALAHVGLGIVYLIGLGAHQWMQGRADGNPRPGPVSRGRDRRASRST